MEAKAEKKTAAPKAKTPAAAPAPKPAAKKATKSDKTLIVVQHGSTTSISPSAKATLKGLGLGRTNARRELEDTPAVRGMVRKVRHLVHVEGEE